MEATVLLYIDLITFALFYSLEVNHYIQPTLWVRGTLYRGMMHMGAA